MEEFTSWIRVSDIFEIDNKVMLFFDSGYFDEREQKYETYLIIGYLDEDKWYLSNETDEKQHAEEFKKFVEYWLTHDDSRDRPPVLTVW